MKNKISLTFLLICFISFSQNKIKPNFKKIEQEVFNITLLKAQVKIGEETVAECQMKVATSTQDN